MGLGGFFKNLFGNSKGTVSDAADKVEEMAGGAFAKAKEAALKAKFNASPESADIQKGTMTFVFLVK